MNRYGRLNVAWPGAELEGLWLHSTTPQRPDALCFWFQIGNSSHPQLMNILSLDDKLRRQNVCHKLFSHRAVQSAARGCGECESALLCGSQADKGPGPGPSAAVGHTKHLVTDLSGCMTTLHWAACVWESGIDTWSVFTADLVHTSGIPAWSCPH